MRANPVRNVSAIHQSARHTIFVEGGETDSIDLFVVQGMFERKLRVLSIGPSTNVVSAAEALYKNHPDYYFIVDRDYASTSEVQESWTQFPSEHTKNLLILQRHEIENYFLEPAWLVKSSFLKTGWDEGRLEREIAKQATVRLPLEAANAVISAVRTELRSSWVAMFTDPATIGTRAKARMALAGRSEFAARAGYVSRVCDTNELERRFDDVFQALGGGYDDCRFGVGAWRELLPGKEILSGVLNQAFAVRDPDVKGRRLTGGSAKNLILGELVDQQFVHAPVDLQNLRQLILGRLLGT